MEKSNRKLSQEFVIGVDAGGAKTIAALANLEGKILKLTKTGSSHPRNLGFKGAIENLAKTIEKVLPRDLKNKKILSTFIGLPAMEEELKFKNGKIKRELSKYKKISPISKGKLTIGSDQLVGFRSGTKKKNGLVLIAGSGCVAHGWQGQKEVKVCGWGYLSEMGSAFFVGQKALQAIFKDLDGRGQKTLITKLVFKNFKVKNKPHSRVNSLRGREKLIEKIYYKNTTEVIPPISHLVDEAGKRRDRVAKNILIEAGKELALSAKTAIRKLNLQKEKIPLVLIGSMFNSKIVLEQVQKEVRKFAPQIIFIRPKKEPVVGAVKLALEKISQ